MFNKYCPKWLLNVWESKKSYAVKFIDKEIDKATPELAKLLKERLNLSDEASSIISEEIAKFLKAYITNQL